MGTAHMRTDLLETLRPRNLAYGATHAALTLLLLLMHGRAFGLAFDAATRYVELGSVICGERYTADVLMGRCPAVALPHGGAIGNGWPIIATESLIARLPGVTAESAINIVSVFLMALAVVGATALLRRFGSSPWIAVIGSGAYLASVTVLGMGPFGSTFWGIATLPAVVWAYLRGLSALSTANKWRSVAVVSGLGALTFVILMTDGYGTVFALSAVGLITLGRSVKNTRRRRAVHETLALGIATVIGLGMFTLFPTSGTGWGRSSLGLFRAMGADLVTFFVPGDVTWWGPWSHLAAPADLWGDGTNVRFNFLGYVALVAAIVAVVIAIRQRSQLALWGLVGAVAFTMSLGPSLKIAEVRGPLSPPITYNSYLMPRGDAVVTLPTAVAYRYVPGLSMLRATYRWNALTRLSLIVLAGYGFTRLSRQGKGPAIAAFAGMSLVAIEVAPNVPSLISDNVDRGRAIEQFSTDVATPLSRLIETNSRVVVGPSAQGANDYLSYYLAGVGHYRLYNVGGDKSLSAATSTWPEAVLQVVLGQEGFADNAYTVLAEHDAEAIVIPFFDLRWGIDTWPPDPQWAERGLAACDEIAGDGRFSVVRDDYFAVVTLAK